MKILLLCLALTGCYNLSQYDLYSEAHHNMIQSDSAVANNKIVYRVFTCSNGCGYSDTFSNPSVNATIKAYKRNQMANVENNTTQTIFK